MEIKSNCKLHEATGEIRRGYNLAEVYLDTATKRVVSTDGNIVATVPVVLEDGDVTGLIPASLVKHALKGPKSCNVRVRVRDDGYLEAKGKKGESMIAPRPTGEFPTRYGQVIPAMRHDDFVVMLDASLLYNLARALGSDTVELRFCAGGSPTDAVLVVARSTRVEGRCALGAIMPVARGECPPLTADGKAIPKRVTAESDEACDHG